MDGFFNPRSIAVIGGTEKRGKVGNSLVNNLKTFRGKIFYVNTKGESIEGRPVYRKVSDIHESIDLAIVATPALTVPGVIRDCAKKGIKNIIVISAGFRECNNEYLEEEVLLIARTNKMRILGPNCFGIVNTENRLDTTFAKDYPIKGYTAFVSQSGALWSAIADISPVINVGFSKFISLGDMSDIDFVDCLNYLEKDKKTKSIVLYLEALKDGREFMNVVKKCKKPVIIVKGGKTKNAEKATLSHTGSLASDYEIYKAAFRQAGAYYVESIYEALYLANFLNSHKGIHGKKVFILTNAGGPGILMTDLVEENKLELARVPSKFRPMLPLNCTIGNPLDLVGDADRERFASVFRSLSRNRFYDFLIVVITPQEMTPCDDIARMIVQFSGETKIPALCCFMGEKNIVHAEKILASCGIPYFARLEDMSNLLKNLVSR